MMRSLLKRHPKRRNELDCYSVLDIGSTSIKAVVARREGNRAVVLGRSRRALREGERPQMDAAAGGAIRNLSTLASQCESVLCEAEDATELADGHKIVPDEVYLVVPSPWIRGAIGTGTAQRVALETPIAADECIEPVLQGGRRALRNLGRKTGNGQWELIDATLVAFGVDGHQVTDPVGFRGHQVEATVFVAAAARPLVRSLYSLADWLQLDPPHLIPAPLGLAAMAPEDGLIVEVGAQATGLCLVGYGAPVAVGSVSLGGQAWTQAMTEVFKFTGPRAEALKLAYSGGLLSDEVKEAVGYAVSWPIQSWLDGLVTELQSWPKDLRWAPEIHLCGGASQMPDVQRAMSSARWLERVPFPHTPHVRMWEGLAADALVDQTGERLHSEDLVVLCAAAWAARDRGLQTVDGVLRASLDIE